MKTAPTRTITKRVFAGDAVKSYCSDMETKIAARLAGVGIVVFAKRYPFAVDDR